MPAMILAHPALLRRSLLAMPVLAALPAAAQSLRTPSQMQGPYYPNAVPADADADLLHVVGQAGPARGIPLLLTGIVRGPDGAALAGARIEIWQADAQGIYLHPRNPRQVLRDAGFQGYGRAVADGAGRYAFRTIRPGIYPGRTPHIHLRAQPAAGGAALTTQIYFPNEPRNDTDGLLRRVAPESRALLIARVTPVDGGQRAEFDIFVA
jgi:protocatechuate 3,4-dioxygenase beta subunit